MMNWKVVICLIGFVALPILMAGCRSEAASPTSNPALIYTAAAQTADARLTQIFASTPSATPVPPSPTSEVTQTMAAQTTSALLTQTVVMTPTITQTPATTAVPPGAAGDRSVYVADVTIPDGTVINPGAAFTKTWKLMNAGSTTWTTSYSLAFASGQQMGNVTSVPLSQSVAPGAQIDVSVNMVAPTSQGKYQGYWKLKNSAGQFFNDSVYVLIDVGNAGGNPSPTPGTAVATPTPTSVPTNPISSLTMAVDQGTYSGSCPHSFTFTATIAINRSVTLTYKLEASSDTPGFVFDLPGPQTRTFDPGTYSIPAVLTFTSTGTGKVWMHVTSPVDEASNKAEFNLTCTP